MQDMLFDMTSSLMQQQEQLEGSSEGDSPRSSTDREASGLSCIKSRPGIDPFGRNGTDGTATCVHAVGPLRTKQCLMFGCLLVISLEGLNATHGTGWKLRSHAPACCIMLKGVHVAHVDSSTP